MPEKLTLDRWNELIRQVNELVEECAGIDPLSEVEGPHKWSRTDIQEMQGKLIELCDDNEFDDIPDKWKQRIIDEFEEVILNGSCCCEDEIRDVRPASDVGAVVGLFNGSNGSQSFIAIDWARLIMRQFEPLVTTTITCDDGDEVSEVNHREGGYGYVGKGFKAWELLIYDNTYPEEFPFMQGAVNKDGYIVFQEGSPWQLNQLCSEPSAGSGNPLGSVDPLWKFPYTSDLYNYRVENCGIQNINGQPTQVYKSKFDRRLESNTGDTVTYEIGGCENIQVPTSEGFLVPAWYTSPYAIRWAGSSVSPGIDNFTFQLRLLCQRPDLRIINRAFNYFADFD